MPDHAETIDRHVIAVDDEPLFLRFAEIPFRTGFCGFCTWFVHSFTDPNEALEFYAERSESIDVLLTDYNMPGVNGIELIGRMRARGECRAGLLPALVVTSDPPEHGALPLRTTIVRKPYTTDDVARGLCEISAVCQTGRCKLKDARPKPKPPAGLLRAVDPDEDVSILG